MIFSKSKYKIFAAAMIFMIISGCATTNNNNVIVDAENQRLLNKYLKNGIEYYKNNQLIKAGKEFNKFFASLDIEVIIDFEKIANKEEYKEQLIKEYINRIEPKLISREENIQSLFLQGKALYEAGQYKNAVEFFAKILAINPSNKEAMEYIINSNIEIARQEEAEKKASKQKNITEYYDNGIRLYSEQDYEKSGAEFKRVMEIDPKYKKVKEYNDKISVILMNKAKKYYKE